MAKQHYYSRVRALAIRALQGGGRLLSPTVVEWDVSGNCQSPQISIMAGRSSGDQPVNVLKDPLVVAVLRKFPGAEIPHVPWKVAVPNRRNIIVGPGKRGRSLEVRMTVRCRECPKCLAQRRKMWEARARREIELAQRTWFVTLTLSPDSQYRMKALAAHRLHIGGTDYEALPPGEQFEEHAREVLREVTLMTKRIRKNSGAKLRGMIVVEKHKSGLPHIHCLIHVQRGSLTWAKIAESWRLGFLKAKLVDNASAGAGYVCKYIAKETLTRIRASLHYGDPLGLGGVSDDTATGKRPPVTANPTLVAYSVKTNDPQTEHTRRQARF